MKIEIYSTSGRRKVLIDGNPVENRLLSVDFNLKGWDDPIVNLCFLPDELIVDADDCTIDELLEKDKEEQHGKEIHFDR